MADFLEFLAESNIRDWQRRVAAGEAQATGGQSTQIESLEAQLFKEIVDLHGAALTADDPAEKARLVSKARGLRVQLLICVERDRPRLAQALDAQLGVAIQALREQSST